MISGIHLVNAIDYNANSTESRRASSNPSAAMLRFAR